MTERRGILSHDILTYDEYEQRVEAGTSIPYIVELARRSQKLLFYGSDHVNNPSNPRFADIEAHWAAFIKGSSNPIALVEGHFDQCAPEGTADRDYAIEQGGEDQFLVHLARRDGIDIVSPEPDEVAEANALASEFGREPVLFYYYARQIQWRNQQAKKSTDIPAEARQMLATKKEQLGWDDVDFSSRRMDQLHQELLGQPPDWDNSDWTSIITTPALPEYVTNRIARASGDFRDAHILRQIADYWGRGRSLFIVYGYSHSIRLEPALRRLVK